MSHIQVFLEDKPDTRYPFLEVGGTRYPVVYNADVIQSVPGLSLRQEDVMLCGFVRSGTHWCFEIINMLLRESTATVPWPKDELHIERVAGTDLATIPSPRVLNGHMHFKKLPTDVIRKRIKVVYLVRQPRDVLTSWYKLMAKYFKSRNSAVGSRFWEFDEYVKLFLNNELAWGSWFDHVIGWERGMSSHPTHPFFVLHYEDLVTNTVAEIKKLADFLDKNVTMAFCGQVAKQCGLDNMRENKLQVTEKLEGKILHYMEGGCGAWKKQFTVAVDESFNRVYQEKMKGSQFYERYKRKE